MKSILKLVILVTIIALMFALPAAAMKSDNLKGEVTSIDKPNGTLAVLSNKGETIIVRTPDGFDFSDMEIGDSVLVRGELLEDGSLEAKVIKVLGSGDDDGDDEPEDEEDEGEGSRADNSAFCAEDKQEKSHPVAVAIAETYGVTEEDVMSYFCDGYGYGAIMLAFQTMDLEGTDVATLLARRTAGQGWGQIWKELGLIGKDKQGKIPPGQLKR